MRKTLALFLTVALMLSLAACGGGDTGSNGTSGEETATSQENQSGPIQSKGLFLLERAEGEELDDLTAQETMSTILFQTNLKMWRWAFLNPTIP